MKKIYEWRVVFEDCERHVVAQDRETAQERAIEEMEDEGVVHSAIQQIIRVQGV